MEPYTQDKINSAAKELDVKVDDVLSKAEEVSEEITHDAIVRQAKPARWTGTAARVLGGSPVKCNLGGVQAIIGEDGAVFSTAKVSEMLVGKSSAELTPEQMNMAADWLAKIKEALEAFAKKQDDTTTEVVDTESEAKDDTPIEESK